jgi:CubicO group peptidase (beta-lactamase class C family)
MKAGLLSLLSILILLASACQDPNVIDGPPPGQYAKAAQYSREHSGQALLVMKDDQIVYEDASNGGNADRPYQLFSGTKSFNCALAIAAIQDGLLTGFDENVSSTLTEWQSDPKKSLVTVRQLLNFTSGISQKLLNLAYFATQRYAFNVGVPMVTDPGSTFAYGETSLAVFEELVARKLKASATYSSLDPQTYLKARVFDPIGLHAAAWIRLPDGTPMLSFGAILSAREWIKYGKLLRDHGSWNGTQVLPSAQIDQCTTGSSANAGYGLNLWLNAAMPAGFKGFQLSEYTTPSFTGGGPNGLLSPGGPTDLFAAVGMTDHRMYIVRSQNLVAVRIGHGGLVSDWSDAEFLQAFFGL